MKQKFNITGMTCSACSARVEKVANALPGMKSAAVNLLSNSMMAEYDADTLTADEIIAAALESRYSRIPIYDGRIDNIIGILQVK